MYRGGLIFFVLLFFHAAPAWAQCVNLSDDSTYGSSVTNLTGVYYINHNTTLCQQNYLFDGTAGDGVLRFNSSNIFLDCANSHIRGINLSGSIGVFSPPGKNSNTLVNCSLSNYDIGVSVNSSNNIIRNNTLNHNEKYGILLGDNTYYHTIDGIRASYNKQYGIYSHSSNYNIIRNVSASNNKWYGLFLFYSCFSNYTNIRGYNNTIGFMHLFYSCNNTLTNVDAQNNNYSIYFNYNSSDNLFIDSNLANSTQSDVYIDSSVFPWNHKMTNTFLNVSFREDNITFIDCDDASDICHLYVKWYAFIQVNYSNSTPVVGALVKAKSNKSTFVHNASTDYSGLARFNLTGYLASSVASGTDMGDRTYYSDYKINVSDGVYNRTTMVNLSTNKWVYLILGNCTQYCFNCSDCSNKIKDANAGDLICLGADIINESQSFCINLSINNIKFSCQGHQVDANASDMPLCGIFIYRNFTQDTSIEVRDCRLSDWQNGDIYLWNADDNLIQNINQEVHDGPIDNGFHLKAASHNVFVNISVEDNSKGVFLSENSSFNSFYELKGRYNHISVYSANSNLNNITNSTLQKNVLDGVYLENSHQNTISNVRSEYNGRYGFFLNLSDYNVLYDIKSYWNNLSGLFLWGSQNNNISNMSSKNNNNSGVFLYNSSFNTLRELTAVKNNLYGMLLEADSDDNTIKDCRIMANNLSGLYLKVTGILDPDLNHIFNCFFNNTLNALLDDGIGAINHFNTSILPGPNAVGRPNVSGNYWSTPSGDGFSQICNNTDNNSFCDEPYNLTNGSSVAVDWMPLTLVSPSVDHPPDVTLVNPPNHYVNDSSDPVNISFTCSASDDILLRNLTLYIWNSSGNLYMWDNVTVVSSANNISWNISLVNGFYSWNCLAYDGSYQSAWAASNYTVTINYSESNITLPNITVTACWYNMSSVLQGVGVQVSENISLGLNPLSNCWFDVNGSIYNYTNNNSITYWFNLDTSFMYGNYTLTCYANDSGYGLDSLLDQELEVITTTTTTTTTSTTKTTDGGGGGGGGGGGSAPPTTDEGSCFDGLFNCHDGSCEEETDCGGPCAPCVSCSDGIQNQGEEGVDCGGPCRECTAEEKKKAREIEERQGSGGSTVYGNISESCYDGLRNQGEEGVDCGGPCMPCAVNHTITFNASLPDSINAGDLFVLYVNARAGGSELTNVSARLTLPDDFDVVNGSTYAKRIGVNKTHLFSWSIKSNRSLPEGNYTAVVEFKSNEIQQNLTSSLRVKHIDEAPLTRVVNEVQSTVYGFVERVYETVVSEPSMWILLSFSLLLIIYAYHRIRTRRI